MENSRYMSPTESAAVRLDVGARIEELKAGGMSQADAETRAWQEWQQTPDGASVLKQVEDLKAEPAPDLSDAARAELAAHAAADDAEAAAEVSAEAAALYDANGGGFHRGQPVRILAEGEMAGAVGEIDGFDGAGHPVVYVSGIVNSKPVHGYFVYPAIELEEY